ncbi:hypothetical protein [Lysinibacillus sp. 54212]|uniref:hypothetical protein n=1 Tax=Lysinibacillus sp. 54212 TaxID=3119829 RepID=UPI002FC5B268
MNKRKLILLSTIAILFILVLIYFLRGLESQTFAKANLIHPDYTYLTIDELNIYSEEDKAMIPVKISHDDKEILTDLMLTTEVSGNTVRKPSSTTPIVEQKFRDSYGSHLSFTLYKKNDNYYVAVLVDIYTNEIEWFKL